MVESCRTGLLTLSGVAILASILAIYGAASACTVNLGIDSVSAEDEEDPGACVILNDDDDNDNNTPDKNEAETSQVVGENDLVALYLSKTGPNEGTITLSAPSGGGRIKVWKYSTRCDGDSGNNPDRVSLPASWDAGDLPSTLWVEGVSLSAAARDVELRLTWTDSGGSPDPDQVRITVVKVDLDIASVADKDEENPGRYVGINDDDDNSNQTADKDEAETAMVSGENDLIQIFLSKGGPNEGSLTFSAPSGGSKIKVWKYSTRCDDNPENNPDKVSLPASWNAADLPSTLWVEGVVASSSLRDTELKLEWTDLGATPTNPKDTVKVTVVSVDLDVGSVAEASEEDPGGNVTLNNDDDDNNATADKDESETVKIVGENDLVQLSLSKLGASQGSITLSAVSGGSKIKVWEYSTRCDDNAGNNPDKVTLPASWDVGQLPSSLWVEGVAASGSVRDVVLKLEWTSSGVSPNPTDVIKITVVGVDLDIGSVADGNEDNPGAYVILNNDDDNNNATLDKDESDTTEVTGEDNLVQLSLGKGGPSVGTLRLSATSEGNRIKVWEYSTRCDGNSGNNPDRVTLPATWNAADLPSTLWVEGVAVSNSARDVELKLEWSDLGEEPDPSDTVRMTVLCLDLKQTGVGCTTGGGTVTMRKKGDDSYSNDTYSDDGDRDIGNPIWVDANYNDTPETEDPVCFLKSKTAKLESTTILIIPQLSTSLSAKITVEGTPSGEAGTVQDVEFGPLNVTLPTSAWEYALPQTLNGNATVGDVVNNFEYELIWKFSIDGGTTWHPFQESTQKVFVLLGAPLTGYAGSLAGNPTPVATSLSRTARRIDWATKVCEGKDATNIEVGAASYILGDPGPSSSHFTNPFTQLDAANMGDCISLANLAATALRINGIDARPAWAYPQYKVLAGDNSTWGWDVKEHQFMYWDLGYLLPSLNRYEGFFQIGEFVKWTSFPSKGYTVWPQHSLTASAGKEKYLPIYVLNALSTSLALQWHDNLSERPDVFWESGINGVDMEQDVVSWTFDDSKDGNYNVYWNKGNSTLRLYDGSAVSIPSDNTYTLSCTHGSIQVDVVKANLPGSDTTGVVTIAPARTQAPVP